MKRRDFIKTTLLIAAGSAMSNSSIAIAGNTSKFSGVIYTSADPGKWAKKIAGHEPKVSIEGKKVMIATHHSMSEEHYIVRHTLVLEDGTVVGAKTFYPLQDTKAVSTFELPAGYKAKFYATSFCNLHDLWVTENQA